MNNRKYQICTKCIMDTSDPEITFDEQGVCSHCRHFEVVIMPRWFPNEVGQRQLQLIIDRIKNEGIGKDYDCIIGLSGGVDSSYLAYVAKQYGLRPLALHVDAGWNSELAVKNIESIVKILNIDLYTHVVDWEEIQDLQVAFFRAGVENLDIPQDHAFIAAIYQYAVNNEIQYILSGHNFATESIMPRSWGHDAMDFRHLKAIHKRFGKKRLATYPTINFFQYHFYYPYIKKIRVINPLNYLPYNKADAMRILEKKLGWRYYGGKHYESRFTKFFQAYYLPTKFGYDKKRAHLSSLIVSGQMSRECALKEMKSELYLEEQLREDRLFIIKKLGLSEAEFDAIQTMPNRSFADYSSNQALVHLKGRLKRLLTSLRK